jgi:2,3-dihydro-2,3-dihydroxybenzoate dehydrogenase
MSTRGSQSITLITGAASGIGLSLSAALCRERRPLALCDRDAARLAASARWLREEQVEQVVAQVESEQGAIDAVALVAGVLHLGTASEISPAHWQESLSINSTGVFHAARATVKRMAERGRGSLVTVASNAGSTPRLDMAAYCASKAAAIMFTRCLALEVAHLGVRCNVVSPGSTDTPMLRAMVGTEPADLARVVAGNLAQHRLGIPLGRVASADDIASVVLFLLSEQARHITMQEIRVDGGATL